MSTESGNTDLSLNADIEIQAAAASDAPENLLTNGSFENPVVEDDSYQNYGSVDGWTAISGGRIELWRSHRDINATDGFNFLELDNADGQDGFFQDVQTSAGQEYTLTFDARLREAANTSSQGIEILWNGVVVATFTPGSTD